MSAPNERPPVRGSTHRRRRRRRMFVRVVRFISWGLIALSIVLAIFVHPGLLGIGALVAAAAVAVVMLHPRKWLWLNDEDE